MYAICCVFVLCLLSMGSFFFTLLIFDMLFNSLLFIILMREVLYQSIPLVHGLPFPCLDCSPVHPGLTLPPYLWSLGRFSWRSRRLLGARTSAVGVDPLPRPCLSGITQLDLGGAFHAGLGWKRATSPLLVQRRMRVWLTGIPATVS